MLKNIINKFSYEIELITILFAVLAMGSTYGVIEAKWIPTDQMDLPIMGRWSYYHVGLLTIMAVSSLSLCLCHIQWMLIDRKKYIILMCLAALPLSLMVEDAAWFVTKWRPIGENDWTMISSGLGINLGLTWIPLWYIIVILFSGGLFWLASYYAEKGYREYLKDINNDQKTISH